MKSYAFFAHFNRIAMQRGEETCWTVHFRGTCWPAAEIEFKVPVVTRYRANGPQPRATLRGRAQQLVHDPYSRKVTLLNIHREDQL